MTTENFLNHLRNAGEKELIFEYASGQFIPNAYHITEVKNAHIDSVDCGGNEHSYDETIVQLWLSGDEQKERCMSAAKAMKIFDIVEGKRPLKKDTELFFEYGYEKLATSVYRVKEIKEVGEKIIVNMEIPNTVCKPRELQLNTLSVVGEGCCGPGTGCC